MKTVLILILIFSLQVFAQKYIITGTVSDADTHKPLVSANLNLLGTGIGTTSTHNGFYSIDEVPGGTYTIKVSYVGYKPTELQVEINNNIVIDFKLIPSATLLEDTIVEATLLEKQATPFSFSEITSKEILSRVGSRDVIYSLNKLPGSYTSPQGGGTGDSRLNLRGFDQTNIGVMINGVILNNPENGEVYWSNYAGISDAVDNIQVQRGAPSVPYVNSSVGGLMNIVTTGFTNTESHTKFNTEFGSNNFRKSTLTFSTPLTNNFSLTALISKKRWDGYVDQTSLNEFTYYLSAGTIINQHSIILQIIGSPQTHGQRISPSTISQYEKYGSEYNPDWGYLNGRPLNIRDNKFHKPSFNIIHNWVLNRDWVISNLLYYTYASGGGTVPPYVEFRRTQNGQIDFQNEWNFNSNNIDPLYDKSLSRTLNPLRDVVHKHTWLGGITSVKYSNSSVEYLFGLEWKYYAAQNYATIGNLLGGDYYIGFANKNRNPNTLLKTGDKIDYDADSFAQHFKGFFQTKFELASLNIVSSISVSNTSYNRKDYFNYAPSDKNFETGWESFFNYSLKTGVNYSINNINRIYINLSYFTKAPISFNVFDYSNNKYKNVVNEKVFSTEIGYGLELPLLNFSFNYYLTEWKDKAISKTVQDSDTGQFYFYNISGASANHTGIETEMKIKPFGNFIIDASFSYAVNRWTSNVNAILAPESDPTQTSEFNSYTKNLYVGNSPMTRGFIAFSYPISFTNKIKVYLSPSYSFFGRLFADYDPSNRINENESGINSWRLPDFYTLDFHSSVDFDFHGSLVNKLSVGFNIFNILNDENIVYALDGAEHNIESVKVFYGQPRSWNLSLTIEM